MKVLVLSDIHGNLAALEAVMDLAENCRDIAGCILLGDLIDYGMHSNEVISLIGQFPFPILCNIWGNHERAICLGDFGRFSSQRGRDSARNTGARLKEATWKYIRENMVREGFLRFDAAGKKCLAVHGSLEDCYWKSIDNTAELSLYREYDYVFSGHSHIPHFVEKFFVAEDERHRNQKKTVFINPGSVGQPRNHNPNAQFAVLDFESGAVTFQNAEYDIEREQAAFDGETDLFYRDRLEYGI